jgi:hypothetical protein
MYPDAKTMFEQVGLLKVHKETSSIEVFRFIFEYK